MFMEKLFIPCRNGQPLMLSINGRDVLVLSSDQHAFSESSLFRTLDDVQQVEEVDSELELALVLEEELGVREKHIVIAPSDCPLDDVVGALESELPWLH
jgi:hypothetical protein